MAKKTNIIIRVTQEEREFLRSLPNYSAYIRHYIQLLKLNQEILDKELNQ